MKKFKKFYGSYDSLNDTIQHIEEVRKMISTFNKELKERGIEHDYSKLEAPEKPIFDLYTPLLKNLTYGSDEYKVCMNKMKTALKHHYENNSHHPEHHRNGIEDMTLIDVVEMFCDWKAAVKRHKDGDILKSIEINTKRFNISPQLSKIFLNTNSFFEDNRNHLGKIND